MPRHDTQHWLDKAESDEKVFDLLQANQFWESACYHAQQAGEKFIKAALVESNTIPPYIHNLANLLALHPAFVHDVALVDAADRLTPMANTPRYPGFVTYGAADTSQAGQDLALVKAWALALIP